MRVLIRDYSSAASSQATYFADQINRLGGATAGMWNGEGGLYNAMDQFKPDVLIIHCQHFDNDFHTYMKDEETALLKKVFFVANDLPHQAILDSEVFMKNLGYTNHTYITNNIQHLNKAPENTVYLPEAADVSLVNGLALDYKINTLLVVDKVEDIGEVPAGSCHIMSTNPELRGKVDICRDIRQFSPLLKNYRNVSIRSNVHNLPQIYFDAVLSGARVSFDSNNPHCKTRLDEICKKVFDCDCGSGDLETIYNIITNKHLSTHRVETLLSLMSTANGKYFEL